MPSRIERMRRLARPARVEVSMAAGFCLRNTRSSDTAWCRAHALRTSYQSSFRKIKVRLQAAFIRRYFHKAKNFAEILRCVRGPNGWAFAWMAT